MILPTYSTIRSRNFQSALAPAAQSKLRDHPTTRWVSILFCCFVNLGERNFIAVHKETVNPFFFPGRDPPPPVSGSTRQTSDASTVMRCNQGTVAFN